MVKAASRSLPSSPFWIGFDEARLAVETIVDVASDDPEERPTVILLTGASGMGKTSILREAGRRIAQQFKDEDKLVEDDAGHNPMIRVVIPSSPTSVRINLAILWKQGQPLTNSIMRTADLKVVDLLRAQRTRMVAIDNIHAAMTATGRARIDTLNALRFLMSEGTTPMVLAGLERATDILAEDEELSNRSIELKLNRWKAGPDTQRVVFALAKGMNLQDPERFKDKRYAAFLHKHSGGITGEFKRLLHWGGKMAKRDDRTRIEMRDLEKAAGLLPRRAAD